MEQIPQIRAVRMPAVRVVLPLEHHLEKAWRFDDIPSCFLEFAILDHHTDVAVPFDTGQVMDVHVEVDLHAATSSPPKKLIRSEISRSLKPRSRAMERNSS